MIYLFDKDEKLIKIVRKSAVKTALQKYALTTERYVSDRLTVELKGLNADELEQVEYMAIQTMEDAHAFHYFYVAQKSSDELTTLIGVQSGIEELRKSPIFDKRPKNAFARDVITDLLAGTNWQARFVGETTPHSTNFYYTSIFDALKKVCEVWDLEMQFFVEMNGNRIGGRYIDFKRRIGEAVGKRVVYGHNALQILQEVERTNIFTALVGRGKGEETGDGYGRKITFENVAWSRTQGKPVDKPKGQKYLELPLMTRQYGIKNADGSMRPKIGFVDFSEEENPEILIERTYKALVDTARPQLTLKTSSVYLKGVKIGDTIRVVRHDKKLDYDTRIFEITFNRLNNQSSDIKLGDRIGESNEAKIQTIADKAVEQFVNNEFSNFVQNLPDYLPSADGFNNNWYGAEDPVVKNPGKVLINDIWYKPDPEHEGHKIMLRWTGEVWEEILRTYESESLRDRIAEEIARVTQSMQAQSEEHDRQVADILSKTQSIETLANQAKSDAASAIARANQVKAEAIADARAQVATVSQALNTAKTELQSAIASADQKARDSQASATALRNDLNLQASKILEQARAQTALTSRVTSVETLADGTKTTVAELSKTISKATGDIASVSSRTKTVEDTLSQTRTQYEALTQTVNTQTGQIDSINRKTADLQSGIDGVTERFESLQVGGRNYILNSDQFITSGERQFSLSPDFIKHATGGRKVTVSLDVELDNLTSSGNRDRVGFEISVKLSNNQTLYLGCWRNGMAPQIRTRISATHTIPSGTSITTINYCRLYVQLNGTVSIGRPKVEISTLATDFTLAEEDLRSEIAEYKRTVDQNYAGLQSTVSTLDGKVTQNKTEANQTAAQLSNRLTSLETYKDGESTRAQAYFEASKTETAKQLTAERTAIANNYVAKSVYEEDIRGTTLKLNEIKSTADTAKQNLATYQNTVDRKLEELTSSTQTLDGKVNTASAKVDTVAGQIRTEISEVEGKIPTETSGNLLLKSGVGWSNVHDKTYTLGEKLLNGKVYTIASKYWHTSGSTGHSFSIGDGVWRFLAYNRSLDCWVCTFTVNADVPKGATVKIGSDPAAGLGSSNWVTLVKGSIALSQWQPAGEDLIDEISSVKTTITQTASGVEQLSTSLSTTNNKVTTAETKISQLISDVSSKVSQTDYNTLTGRVDNNETAITQNAQEISKRLTKTQVDKAITDKGYQTKSDVDSNITGRGYITNSALQPYALSTTVQNLVKETADSFSRTISETRALIPTSAGGRNYLLNSKTEISGGWSTKVISLSRELLDNLDGIKTVTISCDVEGINVSALNSRKRFGLSCSVEINGVVNYWEVWQAEDTAKKRISQTFTVPEGKSITKFYSPTLWIQAEGNVKVSNPKLEFGVLPTDWSPAPEDLATVTALHSVRDTVDSHTRTITEQGNSISQVIQTAQGLVTRVSDLSVGAVNRVRGSLEMNKGSGSWASQTFRHSGPGSSVTVDITDFPGGRFTKAIRISGVGAGIAQNTFNVDTGPWTISYWVKGASGTQVRMQAYWSANNSRTGASPTITLSGGWERISFTAYNTSAGICDIAYLYLESGTEVFVTAPQLENGTMLTDHKPAPEDNDSAVQAVSTQVSQLAGSWAVKNLTNSGTVLNQLNLNKDGSVKIDGKLVQITGTTYIQDGVITSAKIGKGQIGTAHIGEIDAGTAKIINLDVSNIKGLDAEFIKAKIENAFIGWMKGKTITAQNEAMTIGLNDAFIRFNDNAKIEFQSENNTLYRTKNGTSAFIHFRDDSYNGVYTAMGVNADNTGTQNDYSSGSFAGVRVIRSNPSRYSGTTVDQVQLVGDEIRIRHGYGYENDYLVIKWDNQGKIDLIKFLRSVASKLGLPLT